MGVPATTAAGAPQPRMPRWRIIMCTVAMCGIQLCYAAQINLGTSTLLLLGIEERSVSLAWLAGPVSGLVVQPIVGYLSDACAHPLGRRRPFLLVGALLTAAALTLFANAPAAAAALGAGPRAALALAVAAFFLLDFSVQAIQAPLRALVTDVVPRPQRAFANAYVGVFTGLGNLLGGLLAARRLSESLTFFTSDTQAVFAISAVLLLVTVLLCVVFTSETPLVADGYSPISSSSPMHVHTSPTAQPRPHDPAQPAELSQHPREGAWRAALSTLRHIPRPFWRVFAVQLCTWCGFFTLFVYVNSWVGRNIYLGDGSAPEGSPERDTFESGVRLGGKGNALTAAVTLLYSLALPYILPRVGVLRTYAFSQLVEAACLLCARLLRGIPGQKRPSQALRFATMADIGAFGIVWATTMGVPWTLIGDALDAHPRYTAKIGLFTTVFNASQSFPQFIVAFAAPAIMAVSDNDPSAVMFVGGVCALLGAVLVYVLRVDIVDQPDEEAAAAIATTP